MYKNSICTHWEEERERGRCILLSERCCTARRDISGSEDCFAARKNVS